MASRNLSGILPFCGESWPVIPCVSFRPDLRKHPFWTTFHNLGLPDSLIFPYAGFMTTTPEKSKPGRRRRHNDHDWGRTGETLRQLRIDRDVTQAELATAIGFRYQSSIVQIEQGLRPLTDGKLIKAARFLDVQPLAIRRPEPNIEAEQ